MLSGNIAPKNLLKGICCNCLEGDSKAVSDNEMYTCIESGMICVAACGVCCGHCSNGEEKPDADLVSNE